LGSREEKNGYTRTEGPTRREKAEGYLHAGGHRYETEQIGREGTGMGESGQLKKRGGDWRKEWVKKPLDSLQSTGDRAGLRNVT